MVTCIVVLAILTNALGVIYYGRYLIRGRIVPNISTWLIWLFVCSANLFSYINMSQDFQKSIVALMFLIATVVILGIAFYKGKLRKPERWDIGMLLVAIAVCIQWYLSKDSTQANMLLQVAYVMGILPTIIGLIRNTITEESLPWYYWSVSHALGILVVLFRWTGNYSELFFSSMWIILTLIVASLAKRNKLISHHKG